ncbi:MAG: TatD family hydrolase [Candidatus Omnitrophica bacterium]|nr:TatD family hydrolase [Candidatus Omnitrophota bacterium]
MLTDTHCHLDFPEYGEDLERVIENARQAGIAFIVNIGSSLKSSREAVSLSAKYDFIYAAVGLHPHEWKGFSAADISEVKSLAANKKVVAIGECGLDYHRAHDKERQKQLFSAHIDIAKEKGLPLVIHTRDAHNDTLDILRRAFPEGGIRGVVHCFSGDEKVLSECLELGLDISFTCNITYPAKGFNTRRDPADNILQRDKKAEDLRKLVGMIPLERLLLETDAPFLPPQELRGRRNEPAYVKYLADAIAEIKGISFDEVSRQTEANARRLFGI